MSTSARPPPIQVTAVSSLPLTYQWYVAAPGSSTFTPIAGSHQSRPIRWIPPPPPTPAPFSTLSSATVSLRPSPALPRDSSSARSRRSRPLRYQLVRARAMPSPRPVAAFQLDRRRQESARRNRLAHADLHGKHSAQFHCNSEQSQRASRRWLHRAFGGSVPWRHSNQLRRPTAWAWALKAFPARCSRLDTYHNAGDPTVPYVAVGRGETALFGKPWFNVNTTHSCRRLQQHAHIPRLHRFHRARTSDRDNGRRPGFLWKYYCAARCLSVHHCFHRWLV